MNIALWILQALLAAVELILPLLTGIQAWLSWLAAAGRALVMLLAAGFHVSRGEGSKVPANPVLLLLSAAVALGRAGLVPA